MKRVKAELAEKDPEAVAVFEKGAAAYVKKIIANFKDYEFSRLSMNERWQAGQSDMRAALQLLDEQPPPRPGRLRVLDHQAGARAVRDDPPPLAQPADGAAAPDDQKR